VAPDALAQFVNATSSPVGDVFSSRGVAWGDYDGDGDQDIYVSVFNAPNRLFRNDGGGTFVNVAAPPIDIAGQGEGVAWGDYDNDGDLDLYVASQISANKLLRNEGNGTFVDATTAPLNYSGNSRSVTWADYDQDGDLDLYLVKAGVPNSLFRNDVGTFVEITGTPLAITAANPGQASWGDYDNDGDLDLYFAINGAANKMFRNDGDGTFVDATSGPLGDTGAGTGVVWGDYDNDGDLDLFLANSGGSSEKNKLFRNDGSGSFADVTGWTDDPTANVAVSATVGSQVPDQSIPDGGGGTIVVWGDQRKGTDPDIYVQRISALGTPLWTANGVALCTTSDNQYSPTVASDGAGGAIAAWQDLRGGGVSSRDIYAQRVNASGAPQWTTDGKPVCTSTGDQAEPTMISDGAGGAIIAWSDPIGKVFAQRLNAAGNPQWTLNGVSLSGVAGGTSLRPVIVSDGAGGAIVAWFDQRSGGQNIFAQRVNASGSMQWSADGVSLSSGNANGGFTSSITTDGAGGAIVAWVSGSTFSHNIYAQRINASGSPLWTATGVLVCPAAGERVSPTVTADGAGGAIIAWEDNRAGAPDFPVEIYAQRMSSAGAQQWAADGVALRTGGNNSTPSAVSDGAGGAIVTWVDYRSGAEIYAQRVDGSGTTLWAANGIGVTTATGNQDYQSALVPDGVGGAIATWEDFRNGTDYDIYTQRINASGSIGDPLGWGSTVGVAWGDYDLDGDLDLLLGNSQPKFLLRNEGNGRFEDVTSGSPDLYTYPPGAKVTWADYDQDGDLDIYRLGGSFNRLYRNDLSTSNHWLQVKLVGTRSNRSGIGARVTVVRGGTREIQEVSGGSGYFTQNPLVSEFGLGTSTAIDSLIVRWPSGIRQVVSPLPAVNAIVTVTESDGSFVDATSGPLGDVGNDQGVAWGDYDGDGDLDLYLAKNGGANKLFRNNGGGVFSNATSGPLGDTGEGQAVAWGDYDNDGDLDLYLVNWGSANKLLRNDGGGVFANVTSGPLGYTGQGAGVAWGDYDRDGDIDLYLANWGQPNKLFRNEGGGVFVDATSGPLGDTGQGVGVAWGDYDNDGDLDLYLANGGANKLFRNDGGGVFADVTSGPLGDVGQGQGVAWGDYDNDGDLDLYLANNGQANKLFRNDGGGVFADVTSGPLGDPGAGTGVAWGDYDNDGDLDLFLANFAQANKLFRNDGGGVFVDAATAPLTGTGGNRGAAWGDYDGDGDIDLYVSNFGSGNKLYRNALMNGNRWLEVNLVGTLSNRAAIGARVRAVAGSLKQIQEVSGGSGYLSQNSLTAEFGFGATATVDTLEIRWPSGIIQRLTSVATNQTIQVREPDFSDVTSGPLGDLGTGRGVAWGDYDGDGDLDLYLVNEGSANKLFRNDGNGAFVNATPSPLGNNGAGQSAAWGDYDNDGDLDLYLSNYQQNNRLFRNEGAASFVDIPGGPMSFNGRSQGVTWADYDNDGDLDMYLVVEIGTSRLIRNDGESFVALTTGPLFDSGRGHNAAWGDYDNDGDLDLYLVKQSEANSLFRNDGSGAFVNVTSGPLGDTGDGRSAVWGDYDNDGDLDLYLVNNAGANKLFRNEGNGTFVDATSGPLGDTGNGTGATWGDFDNDGDFDLYLVNNGSSAKLFRNEGGGTFVDATNGGPLGSLVDGDGAASADYDGDGDVDLFVSTGTADKLFRNEATKTNKWLEVKLVGTRSNVSGIGARVTVVRGGTRRIREVSGGTGFFSENSLPVEFGLGTSPAIDSLIVSWPSGIRQVVSPPPSVNTIVTVTETDGSFADATNGGLAGAGTSQGAAWGDYDGDGDLDLYLSNYGTANKLFRNDGTGTFTDVTSGPLGDTGNGQGAAWGDYDGDGDLDLYLSNDGGGNKLFRNEGGGAFVDATSGPLADGGNDRGVTWVDYDKDGDLDLYLVKAGGGDRLLRNDSGTFVNATNGPLGDTGIGSNAAWGDYDNDGDQDVYLSVETFGSSKLLRNDGGGTFANVTNGLMGGTASGVAWGDYDNDGDLDLYVARVGVANKLFRNEGNGTFVDVTSGPLGDQGQGSGVAWGDYDNDGDLDLYLTNYYQAANQVGGNKLFRNEGSPGFAFVNITSGPLWFRGYSKTAAWGDIDRDGDLDLYVGNSSQQSNLLLRNEIGANNHWLDVNLVGTNSNRNGIGARAYVTAGGKRQLQEVSGGSGYFSQNSLPLEFGLGGTTIVDTLEVRWPSGLVQKFSGVAVDQAITVQEVVFTDKTSGPLGGPGLGTGVAWGDYDGDGDLDLYSPNVGNSKLYRNEGGGVFADATSGPLGNNGNNAEGAVWGDYDNDGDLDLYVANNGQANKLFRNDNGTFADVTSGPLGDTGLGTGVAWADFDRDGDLDLYLANNGANKLFRNDGASGFVNVATGLLADAGATYGVAWGDYDGDGDLDLALANYSSASRILRNDGGTTFANVTPAFLSVVLGGRGVAWGDYDNDGDLDLYLSRENGPNKLIRNDGNGAFADVTTGALADAGLGAGVTWGDYDNDGYLDLYLVNSNSSARLLHNDGRGGFADVASGALAGNGLGEGVAWADYDRDGDLDLYVAKNAVGANRLLRNDIPLGNHWLQIDLRGSTSNRMGVGARVRVVAGPLAELREVSGGSGFLSQDSPQVEFGLGAQTTVDTLEIRWPSGTVQRLTNVATNQDLQVTETEFTDVTSGPLAGTGNGIGVAWGDYDNDGDLDLYLANVSQANKLFRNEGNGVFVDATSGPLGNVGVAGGVAWGDYDNDGDLDLYLVNSGQANKLFRNEGGGTFVDATSGPLGDTGKGTGLAWGDYDNDGDLDIYLTQDSGDPNKLFRNEGGGTFVNATSGPLGYTGACQSVAAGDYDNDGDLDLCLTSATGANKLFRNEGNGVFVDATSGPLLLSNPSSGVAWGDYDGDGDFDLYLSCESGIPNKLFRNEGNGVFVDATSGPLGDTAWGGGVAWGDYDLDGDLDLYLSNPGSASKLFRNEGGGTFVNVTSGPLGGNHGGVGVAWGDYDQDGDLDIYFASGAAVGGGQNLLMRNDRPNGNHWLQVNLVGSVSNRSGIGARVRAVSGGLKQIEDVSGGSGYVSQNSLTAEFGLGSRTLVDTLEVHWPSGKKTTLTSLAVDRKLTVTEPLAFPTGGTFPLTVWAAPADEQGISGVLGYVVNGAGDVNGDGFQDVLVGSSQGKVLLFLGGPTSHQAADLILTSETPGTSPYENFGSTLAGVGDVNKDGYDDWIVGAKSHNGAGAQSGRVYLYFGGPVLDGTPDLIIDGHAANDFFGVSVAGAGDLNQDGYDDWIVGASGDDGGGVDAGRVFVYLGGPSPDANPDLAFTGAPGETFGSLLAGGGDLNQDGYDDVVAGGPNTSVRVFLGGRTINSLPDLVVPILGGTQFRSVSILGDLNGDGYDDVSIDAAVFAESSVRTSVYLGGSILNGTPDLLLTTPGNSAVSASLGDVNGDGFDDFALGDQEASSGGRRGAVSVYYGRQILSATPNVVLRGETSASALGLSVAGCGDVNGDGVDDVVAGDPIYALPNPPNGRAYVFLGAPTWVNVASGTLATTTDGNGVAWVDEDGDGDLDIYVSRFTAGSQKKLFRNDGGNSFSDVTASPMNDAGAGRGLAWADYDNDGDLDVYVSNSGAPNKLFRNEGAGVFVDVTSGGLVGQSANRGVAWGDYDNDGDVDLYLVSDDNKLFRNDGGGVFVDVTVPPLNDFGQPGRAAAWGDMDGDNDLDLYIVNNGTGSKLLRNDNGTFVNVTSGPLGSIGLGKGAEWGDYDNDGDLDIYLVNEASPNKLMRNEGGGVFVDVTSGPLGINGTGNTAAWGDVDNDGDLDLYLTNQNGESNKFFRNQGGGVFVDATTGALKDTGDGRGAAWGDYDGDGDLDLVFTNLNTGVRLIRNDLSLGNHWLHVKAVGQLSNRAGIGARVRVVTGALRQTREISGGSGSFSQASLTAEFGLGAATTVDSLTVLWPSGVTQVRTNVPADQVLTIQEAQFTEIAQSTLNNAVDDGIGVAWGDYDGDGDLDFYVSNEGQASHLYRNEGNGNFVEATPAPLTNSGLFGEGVAWGDYDNDGDLDLYLVNGAPTANRLFRNEGGAVFVDVAGSAGVADVGNGRGAVWGDYDRDGDIDLYLTNNGSANRLFRNEGAGTFVNVATGVLADAGTGVGAAWADYDDDGDLDLCFANANPGGGRILRNDGVLGFVSVLTPTGLNQGVAWADYDNDGDMDVFIAGAPNQLRRNDGGSVFVNVASALLANAGQGNQGGMWGDYDDDGDLDLYINAASGDKLCRNEGGGVFADVTESALGTAGEGRGCAWADYDNDGDLDLAIANLNGPDRLFRNESSNRYHWLEVNLVGTASNRSAIGARVRVRTGALSQVREISGGSGYLSQNSLTEEFGLKNAATVDTLEIRWPTGKTQILKNVPANQRLTVTEASAAPSVTLISRNAAPNTGPVTFSISGSNLDGSSLSVTLTSSTLPSIAASAITSVSGTSVTASFDLTGKATGIYDLTVANVNGPAPVMTGAFVVHAAGITLFRSTTSSAPDADAVFPRTPGPQDTIAFVSSRDGASNLYIKDPSAFDTAPLTALTSLGSVVNPSFSPNGRRVVFESSGSIYILDLETMAAPTVLTTGSRPQWAPSGERIAFQGALSGGRLGIFSIQSTGTGLTQLTDPPSTGFDFSPTWSPDGKEIAFSRLVGPVSDGVYVIPALGGESSKKQIVSGGAPPVSDLSWSPNGRWLAAAMAPSGTSDIYLIDSRGESFGLLQITQGPTEDTRPSWNADGTALAFVSTYAGNADIYILSGITALTDDDADLVPNPLDDCVTTPPQLGQVDRDFNGCGDPTSSFRFSRFWSPDQFPLSYETTAEGDPRITDDSEFRSLQDAFNAWTGVPGVVLSGGDDATRAGPRKAVAGDGKNSITFGDETGYIAGTLAVTLSTVAEADTVIGGRWYHPGEIVDADILFNANEFHFSTATTIPTSDAYDLRAVATHEFGHFFGLSHSAVVGSTMYVVVPRNTTPWSLEQDDIALIRRGYAADTTRSVEGRVLRSDGATPVVGAAVMAIAASAPTDTLQMTVTGIDGRYRFYDLNRNCRIFVAPLDGSQGVNQITASYINSDLVPVAETNFSPEFWDGTETNHDTGTGTVILRPGPLLSNANIILNVDVTPPQIASTFPANGATNVSATGAITIQFNERMDFTSVDSTDIALRNVSTNTGVGGVAAGLEDNTLIAFTPSAPLAYATSYRLTVKAGINDLAGNAMADSTVVLFQTEPQPPVTLASITPSSASWGGAIVIYGEGFDPEPANNTIHFAGASVQPTAATLDRMYAIVPTGATTGTLTVTVGSNTSNGQSFTVLAPRAPPSANLVGERNLGSARPRKMDVAPDGSYLYVATDQGITAIPTFPASLNGTATQIAISGGCTGVIAMPDGDRVLAVRPTSPELQVVDVSNPGNIHLARQISLGAAPLDIAGVPGGAEALVSFADKLALLDTPSNINDTQFGTSLREWTYAPGPFLGPISVSRDGKTIFAATGDNRFALFDEAVGGGPTGSLRSGASPRETVPAPDGESALGVDLAGEILEFDNLGSLRTLISGGGGYVGVAVSPEGDFAYAADFILNRVDVLDLNVAKTAHISSFNTGIDPIDIAVSPDGSTIYVLTDVDRNIEAYDTIGGPYVATVSPPSGGTGTLITLAGSNFNPTPSANLVSIGGAVLTPVSVDPSGSSLVVKQTSAVTEGHIAVTTGGKTSNVVEYKVVGQSDPGNFALTPDIPAGVTGVQNMVRSPDGTLLIVRGSDGTLTALGESPLRTKFHRAVVSLDPTLTGLSGPGPLLITPDGATLYAASRGASRLRVFHIDADSPTPLTTIGVVEDGGAPAVLDAASLDITPDGKRIYVASAADNTIYEIDAATHTISARITGSFTAPSALAMHPLGKRAYALLNDNGVGIRVAVFDIDPNSGTYRTRIATVSLTGGATSMRQLLAAPGGSRVYALIGSGSIFRLKAIDSDSASPNYHLEVGSIQVGSGSLVPLAILNQSGTLAFVADPGTTSLKALDLASFTFFPNPVSTTGLAGAKSLAISREDARLYVGSGNSIFQTDLTGASSLAFVSGTNQVGVENQSLLFPFVVRSTPAVDGAAITFEVVGSGGFGATDAYGYAALDATGSASATFISGAGAGTRTVRARLSGTTIETSVTVVGDTTLVPVQLVSTSPATNVVLGVLTSVGAEFSKGVNPASVSATTFPVKKVGSGTPLVGTYHFSDHERRITFVPKLALEYGASYTADATSGLLDYNGNPLANPATFSFQTEAAPTGVTLVATSPNAGTVGDPVVISGDGFEPTTSGNTVTFGSVTAIVERADAKSLVTHVPDGAESGLLTVTARAQTSNTLNFEVIVPSPTPVSDPSGSVPVPTSGNQVVVTPDQARAYMTSPEGNTTVPILLDTRASEDPIPVGIYPLGIAISPDGKRTYVANYYSGDVSVIDTDASSPSFQDVVTTISIGGNPIAAAVNPNGRELYVATAGNSGDVVVVDTDTQSNTYTAKTTIATGSSNQTVTVTTDGGELIIGTTSGIVLVDIDGDDYGAKQSIVTGSSSQSVTVTPDGGFALVLTNTGLLLVIDIRAGSPTFGTAKTSISTGSTSQAVTVSPDGGQVYVSTSDGQILVYSLTLSGGGSASAEHSNAGFSMVPIDTVHVGENLVGMAFKGRDQLLVVDAGERKLHLIGGGVTAIPCTGDSVSYPGTLTQAEMRDSVTVSMPGGAIQVRAALSWAPGGTDLDLALYQRTGTSPVTGTLIKQITGPAFPESLLVQGLAPGTYFFEVRRVSAVGTQINWTLSVITCAQTVTGVPEPEPVEAPAYVLMQSFPNPFRAGGVPARIRFALHDPGNVRLEVFDVRGALVRTLAREWMDQGVHEVAWDGRTDQGAGAAAGVYFYRLQVEHRFVKTQRLLLLR
jgi:YVTN family beta-propeller protein